ncbi:hypothetical protein Cs7R123_04940 [Catellatospora sp. TT07R-123]|nr:hypothetical protein Cs7R123_04940 [Catellatospora sp. TT07R-123]
MTFEKTSTRKRGAADAGAATEVDSTRAAMATMAGRMLRRRRMRALPDRGRAGRWNAYGSPKSHIIN